MKAISRLRAELRAIGNPERAKASLRFFKTGKGEYGEGDMFYGLTVPEQREIAGRYRDLREPELETLMASKMHEERFIALAVRVWQYQHGDAAAKREIAKWYLAHTERINNWDLVDSSASYIFGDWLIGRSTKILDTLAASRNLWRRRIAVIATAAFIAKHQFGETLRIAETLLHDEQDLIHKAVGWMLREVGKRSKPTLEGFLQKHHTAMPRTMLRYAIEKFSKAERDKWMAK
jgi:3-methyladenine DNA glycosylase AlkD